MKKLFTFLKVLFVILLAVFLIFAGVVFYAYTKINNISDYADRFTYNYAAHQEEERNFDTCVFFDQKDSAFITAFTRRMAEAAVCPVKREIPKKVQDELDKYLNRKRKD